MIFKEFAKNKIKKKKLAIDFDGVIHSYHKGWQEGELYGYVLPNAKETIDNLRKDFEIIIHTARIYDQKTKQIKEKEKQDLENWLIENEIYFDRIEPKLIADIYIDDRALRIDPLNEFEWNEEKIRELIEFKRLNRMSENVLKD